MRHIKNAIFVIIGLGLLITACSEPETPTPSPATGPSTATARVLFANASPNAPQLNFFVNNVQTGAGLAFPNNQTGYNTVQVGAIQLRAKASAGQIGGTLAANDLLFRAGSTNNNNFSASSGRSYSIFVTDTLARPKPTTPAGATDPGGLRFLTTEDRLPSTAAGKSFVRFINLVPNAQSLELLSADTSLLPTSLRVTNSRTGNTGTISNAQRRSFREISKMATIDNDRISTDITTFTTINAGSYNLTIRNSGTPGTGTSPLAAPIQITQTFEEGKVYTLYTRGLVGGTGDQSVQVTVIEHPRN